MSPKVNPLYAWQVIIAEKEPIINDLVYSFVDNVAKRLEGKWLVPSVGKITWDLHKVGLQSRGCASDIGLSTYRCAQLLLP